MKIFYINILEFEKTYGKDYLKPYADKEFKSEKRFWEYTIGRYLVKNIAEKYFGVKNSEIITESSGKPIFKNSDLHFSISHSKNIVIACFDKNPCGIDIEQIKPRNLEKLSKHFNRQFCSLEDFYKFWTHKEAKYKINNKETNFYFTKFKNEYYITVTGESIGNNTDASVPILHFG